MLLMCGDHGIAKYGVSAYPPEVTIQMINGYMRGTAGANVMARYANTDLFVVDIGVNADLSHFEGVRNEKVAFGTEDFTKGPAMTKEQAVKALQVGIKVADECIDKGYNLLVTAEMGIGNTTSTAAIASAMLKLSPELTVGRGTGINDERLQIKRRVVAEGLAVNAPIADDALDVLCKLGGYDHAGLAGMILGGARRGIPTMIDGVNATAAAMLAWGIYPECADYMLCSHLSEEIAHRRMLSQLNLHPVVDAGMRLGEGTGASLAVVVLQTALGLYKEMNRQ
jgi:nicotinate-nucleotide--dimethylbenzimidazole phosphoribosyltransferase